MYYCEGMLSSCICNCVSTGAFEDVKCIKVALTQEEHSKVLVAKMLKEGGEGGQENGGCEAENLGNSSSLLTPTLRQTDQGHREVFHSHLQISCGCLKE